MRWPSAASRTGAACIVFVVRDPGRVPSSCLLGPAGTRLRGHEFHFSRLLSGSECLSPAYSMHDSDGEPLGFEGWTAGHMVAS